MGATEVQEASVEKADTAVTQAAPVVALRAERVVATACTLLENQTWVADYARTEDSARLESVLDPRVVELVMFVSR